jgi:phospholipid-transporting ATPase
MLTDRLLVSPSSSKDQSNRRFTIPCSIDEFVDNRVKTHRYTLISFLPVNLFEQFRYNIANIYFMLIAGLQTIKSVSTTAGVPTMLIPITFIMSISGFRAAYEDYQRHKSDNKENERLYEISGKFVQSGNIKVGNIVKIKCDEIIPADCILLQSANPRGYCFVETASLDGETTLKIKNAVPYYQERLKDESMIRDLECIVSIDPPNGDFDVFKGQIDDKLDAVQSTLDNSNLLLRGTVLKNTAHVYGIVAYTGVDTKIRQSVKASGSLQVKTSVISKFINDVVKITFAFQIFLCLIGGIISAHLLEDAQKEHWYLKIANNSSFSGEFGLRFISWFIILSGFVPISYQVTSEIVKSFQAYFLSKDLDLFDQDTKKFAQVQNSSINDDLGQIEYIFSDKVRINNFWTKSINLLPDRYIDPESYAIQGSFRQRSSVWKFRH